ncbi:signal peptidase I [Nocardioides sp.]|uniref:signal peptidase I n=1 Tax=Nocardioides sp. TaxID=35761 RepID=UPI0039E6584F
MAGESGFWRTVRETAILLVVAVVLAVAVKTFLAQAFYIPSESMEPGLNVNDRILVEKPSYWFGGSPRRGDVVVFADPGDWLGADETAGPSGPITTALEKIGLYPSGNHLVKRVIGVGGDTVTCCDKDGRIQVNGTSLAEDDFIDPQPRCDGPMVNDCDPQGWSATVPKGYLFVMGDNRDESADSSVHLCAADDQGSGCDPLEAFIPVDSVVGKVVSVIWPPSHAKILNRPAVFKEVAAATAASP